MAEACSIASLGQLAWTADWHIRDETYALALRRLIDQQQREPLAAMFGGGSASSSDGQFFRAGGFGRDAGRVSPAQDLHIARPARPEPRKVVATLRGWRNGETAEGTHQMKCLALAGPPRGPGRTRCGPSCRRA